MRVRRLHLQRAPGIPGGLAALDLEGGLTLLVGPNASGKSTLARSIRALAWPELDREVRVEASCDVDGATREVSLHGGRASWSPALEGSFPDAAKHMTSFGLRSLLDGNGKGDRELARELFQELAGGLDLDQAAKAFSSPTQLSAGHRLSRALVEARRALAGANAGARSSSAEEDKRDELDGAIGRAEAAELRLRSSERLRELAEAAAAVRSLEEEGAAFTAGLGQIPEDIKEQISRCAEELRGHRYGLAAASAEAEDLKVKLGEMPIEVEELDALRLELRDRTNRLQELASLERDLVQAKTSSSAAQERLVEAEARLGLDAEEQTPAGALAEEALEALATAVESVRGAGALESDLRRRLDELDRRLEGVEVEVGPDELVGVIRDLREWLRSPDGQEPAGPPAPRAVAFVLIAAGLAALAAAVVLQSPWLSAGLVLGGVGLGLLRSNAAAAPAPSGSARDSRRASLAGSPLAPGGWDEATVQSRLAELEDRLVILRRGEVDRSEHAKVKGELEQAALRLQESLSLRAAAIEEAGVSSDFVDLGALLQAQRLREWVLARGEAVKSQEEWERLSKVVAEELGEQQSWIDDRLPGAAKRSVEGAAAVQTSLEELGDLCGAVLELQQKLEQARGTREDAELRVAQASTALEAAWEIAGVEPEDHGGLDRRLEERKLWVQHEGESLQAGAALKGARKRYAAGEPVRDLRGEEAEQCSLDRIDEWAREDQELAGSLAGLRDERGVIKGKLESVIEGDAMGSALAGARAAEQDVQEMRASAAEDLCARMLLEEARPSLDDGSVPAVLEKARDRFQRFTHGSWQVDLDPDGGFRARDVKQDRERSLEELSDGTRAQLLLAARLAALECSEGSLGKLPLCLDEALSTTDPARFEAIAEVLFDEVDGGRQVIYLTADPGEVQQWLAICEAAGRPRPQVVDLAKLGGEGADWGALVPAGPSERVPLPDPAEHDASSYARALDVPMPDGAQPVAGWHLWLVLRDDLVALRACLERRVATLGVWESVRGGGLLSPAIGSEARERVDDRIELTHALSRAWRVGRGRPVTWKDVADSGAVSDRFEDDARGLLLLYERAPAAFVEAIRALPRFREKSADQLAEYLLEVGSLSDESPMEHDQLVVKTLAACPDVAQRLGEGAAEHVEWLIELLAAGERDAVSSGASPEASVAPDPGGELDSL